MLYLRRCSALKPAMSTEYRGFDVASFLGFPGLPFWRITYSKEIPHWKPPCYVNETFQPITDQLTFHDRERKMAIGKAVAKVNSVKVAVSFCLYLHEF